MFEDLVETVVGPWGIAAVLLVGTNGGRRLLRGAFKQTVKAGLIVSDKAKVAAADIKEMAADLKDKSEDFVAKVKAERTESATKAS